MDDAETIHNWRRLDDRITTSGSPTEGQLEGVAALGVRHVINLAFHTHATSLADEAASVRGLGMEYTHIPVEFSAPSELDFAAFCAAMGRVGTAAVHVHCIFNWRVSAFLYRYRRDVLGMEEAAIRPDLDALWTPDAVWAAFLWPRRA